MRAAHSRPRPAHPAAPPAPPPCHFPQVSATASGPGTLQKLARVFREKAQQDFARIVQGTSKTREKLGVSGEWALQQAAGSVADIRGHVRHRVTQAGTVIG